MPKGGSSETKPTRKEATPLDQLFIASAGLETAWDKRSIFGYITSDDYVLLSARADQITTLAEQARSFVEDEVVKDGISRMAKAYRDSIDLHGLLLRRNDPLAFESVQRAQNVKLLKELKERRYREWDDPVTRDQLDAQIKLIEALMRMRYREDDSSQRLRDETSKIDQSAKQILTAYALEGDWPTAPQKTSEGVFKVGKDMSAVVKDCFKQPPACSELRAQLKTTTHSISSQISDSPLVGSWRLDFMAGNTRVQPTLIVDRQGDKYSAVVKDPLEQTDFNALSISESSFSFVSKTPVGKYSARISGSVAGDRISGTISMTDANGGTYSVPFTGTRVGP